MSVPWLPLLICSLLLAALWLSRLLWLNGREPPLPNPISYALNGLTVVLLGLIAWFGVGIMQQGPNTDTVWIAVSPLPVGQVIEQDDVVAQRRPNESSIARCAGTPTASSTSTPTADPEATATPTPAPTNIPDCAPCSPEALKTPIPASVSIIGRRIVHAVAASCPVTEGHLEPILRVPVPIVSIHSGVVISKAATIFRFAEVLTGTLPSGVVWNLEKLENKLAVKDLVAGQPVQQANIEDYLEIPVPRRFIPAKTVLTEEDFITAPIGVTRILTDTLLTLSDILPTGKTMQAARHLLPGQPLDAKAVSQAAKPSPLTSAYIAQQSLPAFVILTEEDVKCDNKAGDACQGLFNPQAYLLLAKTDKGAAITRAHVITATKPPEYIMELNLAAPGALGGALNPGDWVDVYASPRWLTDTLTVTAVSAPGAISGFSVQDARLLQIAPVGERYRVVLWLQDAEDARAIAAVAAHVEFQLVLRRRER